MSPFVRAYLLRVPVLTLLLLGIGLPLAFTTPLFRGLADLRGTDVASAAFFSFLTAAASMVVANLVLLYGELRIEGKREPVPPGTIRLSSEQAWLVFGLGTLVYATLQVVLFMLGAVRFLEFLGWSLLGLVAAIVSILILTALQEYFGSSTGPEGPYLVIPFDRFLTRRNKAGNIETSFHWLTLKKSPFESAAGKAVSGDAWKLSQRLGPGYTDFDAYGQPTGMLPGHAFAAWLFFFSLAVYLATGFRHYSQLKSLSPGLGQMQVPTLVYVLAAILIGCWLLSGLAFFLDRFRVPVLAALGAWMLAMSFIPGSDQVKEHRFETIRLDFPAPTATPSQIIQVSPDRMILVCAAGGGIQAAAWTAQVLNGLSERLSSLDFDRHVRVISSVSGGSVGAMFYLTTLPGVLARPACRKDATKGASDTSLEAIAWGLVHPDLQRTLLPAWPVSWLTRDRGWALERMLAWYAKLGTLPLASMAEKAKTELPVLILNSTLARLGETLVFSNAMFPDPSLSGLAPGIENFHQKYNLDVRLETAVRMSAAFTYVSPAARPDLPVSEYLVDGGYYDNLGMTSLVAWLRQATQNVPDDSLRKKRILVIEIIGFPTVDRMPPKSQTWFYQLLAPLDAILNARETGQLKRDDAEESLLRSFLGKRASMQEPIEFRYERGEKDGCFARPPLSWHLTEKEKGCIAAAWGDQTENIEKVRQFLMPAVKAVSAPEGRQP